MSILKLKYSSKKYVAGIAQPILFNKETNTFSVELSEMYQVLMSDGKLGEQVAIVDVDTNRELLFTIYKIDYDGSHEDIYGWNYKAKNGAKFLLIND